MKDAVEVTAAPRGGAASDAVAADARSTRCGPAFPNGRSPRVIEAAMRDGRLRASRLRHDRRVRPECGPAALSGRRPGLDAATWWCWTLAASWTDTAPT